MKKQINKAEAYSSIAQKVIQGLFLCTIFFTLAGCAGKGSQEYSSWLAPVPVQLSPAEQAAFNSTGQLDCYLSEKGKNAVKREFVRYLRMDKKTVRVVSQRAAKYLTYTRQIFRKHGLPEELAYLAIVESGYNPQAKSRAGAAGAWQFMPSTGKAYGLVQDSWLDERLDPYKSTDAAARYLKKLYSYFNDWNLAVAAYNAGEGKVMRARKQTGKRDFFELVEKNHTLSQKMRLKDETLAYVPRLLAMTKIMRNLDMLGFVPISPDSAETVIPLIAKPSTDLKALAKAARIPWTEFCQYNGAHKRQVTHTSRQTVVYVPERAMTYATVYLRSGLAGVAQGKSIPIGQPSAKKAQRQATYIVQAGDSMWSIARKHNVKPQDLMRWNNIEENVIQPGDKLVVQM